VSVSIPGGFAVAAAIALLLSAPGCTTWRAARLYHTGTVALEQGDLPRALADLEAAVALVPDASYAHNNLGLAQLSAGRDDLALQSFERATALDCTNTEASENLRQLEARVQRGDAP